MDAAARFSRQQSAFAELSRRALDPADLGSVMHQAVSHAAEVLRADRATVLELAGEDGELWLRAGVGWADGVVGRRLESEPGGYAEYVLSRPEPVIVAEMASEERFTPNQMLLDAGTRSGVAVRIAGGESEGSQAFGVVGVHATESRRFEDDEANFLTSIANLLAAAILRHRQAVELNDTIVQLLVLAGYEIERGEAERARAHSDDARRRTQALVGNLLGHDSRQELSEHTPGDLRRTGPVNGDPG